MGSETERKINDLLNSLLEAERAGVQVISEMLKLVPENDELSNKLNSFLLDEGLNCRIIKILIEKTGFTPSNQTGGFVEKMNRLNLFSEKITLLIKGQQWVAKQIEENLHAFAEGSLKFFLKAIAEQHTENVSVLNDYISHTPDGK